MNCSTNLLSVAGIKERVRFFMKLRVPLRGNDNTAMRWLVLTEMTTGCNLVREEIGSSFLKESIASHICL